MKLKFLKNKYIILIALLVVIFAIIFLFLKRVNTDNTQPNSEQDGQNIVEIENTESYISVPYLKFSFENKITQEHIYKNIFIEKIRIDLDNYLNGDNEIEAVDFDPNTLYYEKCGLPNFDKEIFKNKFIVLDVDINPMGGITTYFIFKNQPDKLYTAWVYGHDSSDDQRLRMFCQENIHPKEQQDFENFTNEIIKTSQYSL